MSKSVFTILVLLIALVAVVSGYYFFGARNQAPHGAQVVVGTKTFRVEIASTTLEKGLGLSGRASLAEGSGMFFIFDAPSSYGFWMKDMKFPIDIIWISGDRVVGFAENAAPEPGKALWNLKIYEPPQAVDRVLEVNAGDVAKYEIKVGSPVVFQE